MHSFVWHLIAGYIETVSPADIPIMPNNASGDSGRAIGRIIGGVQSALELAAGVVMIVEGGALFGGGVALTGLSGGFTAAISLPVAGIGLIELAFGGVLAGHGIYGINRFNQINRDKPIDFNMVGNGGNPAQLPGDAQKALREIEQGVARPNVRNPQPFANDGRGNTIRLPSQDAAGNLINYTEHTVNPRPPRGQLDGKRIVTGSDGSVWYTDDHFMTWTRLK